MMYTKKNLSPNKISILTALTLSIPISIGFFIAIKIWWIAFIIWGIIFLCSYALILYTLQKFIYQKIKLIYKFIYQTKASKREEFYYNNIIPQKSIDEVSQDVEEWATQRKAEIDMLKQNENFRKEFLQNLSHEIKTPIFSIQNYVHTLLNGALQNPEVNIKFLTSISRNTDRLVNLASGLDEISKLESGEQPLHFENFIIQDLVKEVQDSLTIQLQSSNIKCFNRKECDLPLIVYADKEKIRQVISNLIENAIKYGKQNGTIECSFYNIDEKTILIEISDDGNGIELDHLNRIFERFYRTDLGRSRKIGGSGLGLAICKHIIEAHHQNIHVRSKINVGSTFGFTLLRKKNV